MDSGRTRKTYEAKFKARVALEAVRGAKTVSQLAEEYRIHPNQVRQWKNRLLSELPQLFMKKKKGSAKESEELRAELYRQIGELKVELDLLKRK